MEAGLPPEKAKGAVVGAAGASAKRKRPPQRDADGELQPAPFDRLALVMVGPTLALMVWQIGAWATA